MCGCECAWLWPIACNRALRSKTCQLLPFRCSLLHSVEANTMLLWSGKHSTTLSKTTQGWNSKRVFDERERDSPGPSDCKFRSIFNLHHELSVKNSTTQFCFLLLLVAVCHGCANSVVSFHVCFALVHGAYVCYSQISFTTLLSRILLSPLFRAWLVCVAATHGHTVGKEWTACAFESVKQVWLRLAESAENVLPCSGGTVLLQRTVPRCVHMFCAKWEFARF